MRPPFKGQAALQNCNAPAHPASKNRLWCPAWRLCGLAATAQQKGNTARNGDNRIPPARLPTASLPKKWKSYKRKWLQLVQVVCELGKFHFQVLPFPTSQYQILHFTCLQGIARHVVPVVEHALWECLTTCLLTQSGNKSERLGHRQMCLHLQKRGSLTWVFFKNATAAQIHARINSPM